MTTKKYAIASNDLSGVIAGLFLKRQGHDVVLIESGEGWSPEIQRSMVVSQCFPNSDETRTALHNLGSLAGQALDIAPLEGGLRTYEDHGWRDFVGFADNKTEAVQHLSSLPVSDWLTVDGGFEAVWNKLHESASFKRLKYSEVTGVETSGPRIDAFIVGGVDRVEADHFIFCLPPKSLLQVLQAEGLSARHQGRILKTTTTMRLALETSGLPAELPSVMMLVPKQSDEPPVMGTRTGPDTAIFETYVSTEYSEDAESLGKAVKAVKKQIKRALGGQDPQYGRLSLTSDATADFQWLMEPGVLRLGFDNFTFASPLCMNGWGIVPSINSGAWSGTPSTEADAPRSEEPSLLENQISP